MKRWKISGIIIRHLTKGRNVLTIKHFAWIKYTQCLYWQTSICPISVSYLKTGTVYRGIERLMQIFFVCFVSQSIRCLSSHIDVTHQMPNFGGVVLISCSLINRSGTKLQIYTSMILFYVAHDLRWKSVQNQNLVGIYVPKLLC